MQFFDRPSRGSRIALGGSSTRSATSRELLATARAKKAERLRARQRSQAASKLQSALRRRNALHQVSQKQLPTSIALPLLCGALQANTKAVAPSLISLELIPGAIHAACAFSQTESFVDQQEQLTPAVRARVVCLLIGVAALGKTNQTAQLTKSAAGILKALVESRTHGLIVELREWRLVENVYELLKSQEHDQVVHRALSKIAALIAKADVNEKDVPGGPLLNTFVRDVLTVPGATRALQPDGWLVGRLLHAVSEVFKQQGVEMTDSAKAVVLLENLLHMSQHIWSSGDHSSLWTLVSAVSQLVNALPGRGREFAAGDSDDDDEEMAHAPSASIAENIKEALSVIVSVDNVRALFNAAVQESRQATVSVCNLFNFLCRTDPMLMRSFQNALMFWRSKPGEVIGHILPRLWMTCYESPAIPISDDFDIAAATAAAVHADIDGEANGTVQKVAAGNLARDCAPVLLVFARAYSHLLYIHDEDRMIESRRPFNLDEIREISTVLKNALFEALYPRLAPSERLLGRSLGHGVQVGSSYAQHQLQPSHLLHSEPDLFETVAKLLSRLFVCDSRRHFRTDDSFWLAGPGHLTSDRFVDDATNSRPESLYRGNRRNVYGSTFNRNAVEDAGRLLRVAPYLAPFSSRVKIFQNWISEDKDKENIPIHALAAGPLRVRIRRDYIFEDSFRQLNTIGSRIKSVIRVQFVDEHGMEEAGIDGGGVFKEFMNALMKTAFSPDSYALFNKTPDGKLYPNPDIGVINAEFEAQYEFLGRLLGKAIYEGVLVDIPFASFFLSKILRNPYSPNDLGSLDPELNRNLKYLKTCDPDTVEDLGLNFTVVDNAYGAIREKELVRDGKNVAVTADNRFHYVHRVADYRMNIQLRKQSAAFMRGFSDVIKPELIRLFSENELQLLISGTLGQIDLDDLRRNTHYSGGYDEDTPVIRWFWQAAAELSTQEQCRLLEFVTSSPRAPLLGFSNLNPSFSIQRAEGDIRLPTASTCLNLLKLPEYKSLDTVREKLAYALRSNKGFHLS